MFSFCVYMQVAFTTKNNFGKEERELQWVQAQRTLHGLHPIKKESQGLEHHETEHHHASNIADQAKRRAEIAKYASSACLHSFLVLQK